MNTPCYNPITGKVTDEPNCSILKEMGVTRVINNFTQKPITGDDGITPLLPIPKEDIIRRYNYINPNTGQEFYFNQNLSLTTDPVDPKTGEVLEPYTRPEPKARLTLIGAYNETVGKPAFLDFKRQAKKHIQSDESKHIAATNYKREINNVMGKS